MQNEFLSNYEKLNENGKHFVDCAIKAALSHHSCLAEASPKEIETSEQIQVQNESIAPCIISLYESNKTMRLLGYQYYSQIFNSERIAAFDDILKAHMAKGKLSYSDIAMDTFTLGYIYGKRTERMRKKGGVHNA